MYQLFEGNKLLVFGTKQERLDYNINTSNNIQWCETDSGLQYIYDSFKWTEFKQKSIYQNEIIVLPNQTVDIFDCEYNFTILAGQTVFGLGIPFEGIKTVMTNRGITVKSTQAIDIEFSLYKNSEVTENGTLIDTFNSDHNSLNEAKMKFYANSSGVTGGIKMPLSTILVSDKNSASKSSDGSIYTMSAEKYVFKIKNNGTQEAIVQVNWRWYEIK